MNLEPYFRRQGSPHIYWYAEKTITDRNSYLIAKVEIIAVRTYWQNTLKLYEKDSESFKEIQSIVNDLNKIIEAGYQEKFEKLSNNR